MPRNSSGTYSLYTPGNPVVTQTVISSSWANNTLSDLATAMTDSLSRSGDGGMLAGLELANGTSGAPGLSWGSDLTSGMYRAGASDFRWVNATVELLQLTTNLMQLSGTAPVFRINESDAAANNKLWDVIASGEDLNFRVLTDALAATNWLTVTRTAGVVDSITFTGTSATTAALSQYLTASNAAVGGVRQFWANTNAAADNRYTGVRISENGDLRLGLYTDTAATTASNETTLVMSIDRTGTTVDTINFANGTLQYGGIEVGYKTIPNRGISGADNTASTDGGRMIRAGSTGGYTFTLDSDLASSGVLTIMNVGTGSITIAASGTLEWYNGSGVISSGSRTLAVGGVATAYSLGSGNYNIWGTGLS